MTTTQENRIDRAIKEASNEDHLIKRAYMLGQAQGVLKVDVDNGDMDAIDRSIAITHTIGEMLLD